MKVLPVPVRDDNYAYLIIDEATKKAAAVDPYDPDKVSAAAQEHGLQIVAGITTHHHFDHSGGNEKFAAKYPDIPMYGGSNKSPALTQLVKDKETFKITDNIHVSCLATPCHTQDSICYHVTDTSDSAHPGGVFTGDTLFIGGCGRFFEGTAPEMISALSYLATLPEKTIVYAGHEYTAGNAGFANSVDPDSAGVKRLVELAKNHKVTTGESTIGDETEWNVFMRLSSGAVKNATKKTNDVDVMAALREMKNNFRG